MKLGSKIKIINSVPEEGQDQLDLRKYIGIEFFVTAHWEQKSNEDWENGEIAVVLPGEGTIHLNKKEYNEIL